MSFRYGSAVVSFCSDLTSPVAQSTPLAALVVGKIAGNPVAALMWKETPLSLEKDDPLTAAVLRDLPKVLQEHVDQAWANIQAANADTDAVLFRLRDALRNSLHVSSLETNLEQELELPASDEAVFGALFAALKNVLQMTEPGAARESARPRRRQRRDGVMMWEPHEARA